MQYYPRYPAWKHAKTLHSSLSLSLHDTMDLQSNTIVITAECLCKAHTFTAEVPVAKLPLGGHVCHCNSCRHFIGALYVVEATWPQPRENVDTSGLQRYQFSANITYRFCGTCSTPMFWESVKYPSKLGVLSGSLKNIDVNLIKLTEHIYVDDTLDGGASVWLRKPNADGKEIPRYRGRSAEIPWDWPQVPRVTELEGTQEQGAIPIWCHCKGIQLLFRRGDYASWEREELPWFIDPRVNKPLASFDACDSCRLHFGTDIVNWTFVNLTDISQANGNAFPRTTGELKAAVDTGDSAIGTLAYYQSSGDVQRYFCKVCSASAFYACDERPEIVDLAIGLLEAPDGARAEGYLSWDFGNTPAWVNDTRGGWREGLAKRVQADAEEFRIARDYPKNWKRLQKEAKGGLS
ncbi:Mss4-like protein [Hypomontagnella submonticulosa]|nr:Mss4-like protein [Hypomontagnella submonticulosa]